MDVHLKIFRKVNPMGIVASRRSSRLVLNPARSATPSDLAMDDSTQASMDNDSEQPYSAAFVSIAQYID